MPKQSQSWFTGYSRVILAVIFTINFSAFLGYSAYGLTFPAMRESLGLSHFQEGTLAASISVSIILSGVLTGILASRFQARIIAGLGCLLGGSSMIGLGLAPTYPLALVMSSLMGFGMQSGITPGMGLITAWFGIKQRGIASGIGASGGALSFAVLGTLVPWLTHNDPVDGWRHSWLSISIAAYLAGFMSLALLKEKRSSTLSPVVAALSATVSDAYRNRYIWLIAGLAFSSGWASSIQVAFFGEYLASEGINLEISGRLWWILGIVGIGSGVFWGYLSDRIGRGMAFLLSFCVYGLGLLLFLVIPSLLGFIIGIGLIGLSLRAAYTLCGASVGDYVQEHHAAAAFGITAMGAGIGLTIAPPLAGVTADITGNLSWVYLIALVGTVLGLCGSILLTSTRTRTSRPAGKQQTN